MRLTYMKPYRSSVLTYDWFWTVRRKPNKKWKANLKIFLFEKLKAWGWLEQFREEHIQMIEFQEEDLFRLIQSQMDSLWRARQEPKEVLLGYDEWHRLTATSEFNNYFAFTCDLREAYPPIFGLKVRVVPYINGVVVLPEDK